MLREESLPCSNTLSRGSLLFSVVLFAKDVRPQLRSYLVVRNSLESQRAEQRLHRAGKSSADSIPSLMFAGQGKPFSTEPPSIPQVFILRQPPEWSMIFLPEREVFASVTCRLWPLSKGDAEILTAGDQETRPCCTLGHASLASAPILEKEKSGVGSLIENTLGTRAEK